MKAKMYHVFSNGVDEWVDTKTKAIDLARFWKKEHGTVRIYSCELLVDEDVWEDVECIYSYGSFPS